MNGRERFVTIALYHFGNTADMAIPEKQRDLTHLTRNLEDWDIVEKAPHQVWRTLEGRQLIERRLKKLVKL